MDVFCEFSSPYHGYTYLKDISENPFILRSISATTEEIKVVHLRTSGRQYSTILEELARYKRRHSLSLQINENRGFKTPLNAPFLGKYIYVGFLPRSVASSRSVQGYRAGSKDWEFHNCDANPNSYIAFFYNNSPLRTHSYHKRCCYSGYMRKWIDVSKEYTPQIPFDYFRFFEMHMGGCGGYVVPKYSTFSDIVGAVPGFRFGRLFPERSNNKKNSTLTMFFHVNGKKVSFILPVAPMFMNNIFTSSKNAFHDLLSSVILTTLKLGR